ncbi:MAG: RNA polymerase sigma factor [Gemmatimonadota bacterium]
MARHGPELERHLRRMLRDDAAAEDLLQEVWVKAHRGAPGDGPDSNPRAWLYRVATNAALDRLARERRRRCALDGRSPEVQADADPSPDAFLGSLDKEGRRQVRERVARLPRKQRQAVWLRWAQGADYETIAEALACSEESARANVYQGMKRLRTELFDLWEQERMR